MEQSKSQYPMLVYKDITYVPMTWADTRLLGLESNWTQQNGLVIQKAATVQDQKTAQSTYKPYTMSNANAASYKATIASGKITVNGKTITSVYQEAIHILSPPEVRITWYQTFPSTVLVPNTSNSSFLFTCPAEKAVDGDTWYQVQSKNGVKSWIAGWLTKEQRAESNTNNNNQSSNTTENYDMVLHLQMLQRSIFINLIDTVVSIQIYITQLQC